MNERSFATVVLTVVAYIVATFAVQGGSHFGLNAEHYAAIPIMRAQPVIAMGFTAMVIQGLLFAWLFPIFNRDGSNPVRNAVLFSWMIGGFLASYVVFGEAGKYAIPSIPSWIAVEGAAAFVQYTLFGILLGALHRRTISQSVRQPA